MVNKLTLPAKENAVQNKINEVIDALGTATGANTDLSNLSVTGESHFQSPLVSGTSIKTINSTSLLGSGNIDTSQIFIAEYGTTTASQISQALASGKIIFGGKTVSSIDYFYYYSGIIDSAYTFSRVYQNTSEVISISTITNQWNTITKTLANDNLSNVSSIDANSAVQTALNNKANTTLSNVSSIDSGSAVATALNGKADTDLSNLSATGNLKLCGNIVKKDQNVISSTSLNGSSNLNKKSVLQAYLPDDDYTYLVLVVADCDTTTTSSQYFKLSINTGLAGIVRICQARTRSNSNVMAGGGVWVPVDGTRQFDIVRSTSFNGTATVDLRAYWRVM